MGKPTEHRKTFDVFEWKRQDIRYIDVVLRDPRTGEDLVIARACFTGPYSESKDSGHVYQLQKRVAEAFRDWLGPEGAL